MAADFRPDSLGLVTASKRADGHIYLLDGAHRISAARKAKYEGKIATRLFTDLTLAEEAGLFLSLNQTRTVQAIDRFKVRVTMGDPTAVSINNVLKTYGLHVDWGTNQTTKVVSSIVTVEKIFHGMGVWKHGNYTDLLDRVFATVMAAYGNVLDRKAFSRPLLEGLARLHAHFGKRIDQDRLVAALSGVVPEQIVARARIKRQGLGGTQGEAAAHVIHELYNKRLWKNGARLPQWHDVDPRNQVIPADPMEVDPNQYVIDDALEEANATAEADIAAEEKETTNA
jgi:hypothetical protein